MSILEKLGGKMYESLLSSALAFNGNNSRLKSAFRKEHIKTAFVGGSVTVGYSPAGMIQDCYARLTASNIHKITGKQCTSLNLGVSGPASFMGLTLTENDLTVFLPDLVFVEYAVNEALTQKGSKHFESLLRKLMTLESNPAVILIIVFSEERYTCQEYMLYLAKHYNLTAIALMDAMTPLLENGSLDWHDYCEDNVHPNADGQQLIADCIKYYLIKTVNDSEDTPLLVPEAVFGDAYENLKLVDLTADKVVKNGFTFMDYTCRELHTSINKELSNGMNSDEHSVRFSLDCKCLCIVYVTDSGDDNGDAVVNIDGAEIAELQSYSIFGWHNPVHKIVLDEQICLPHEISIQMKKGDDKKHFSILAISYC